MRSVESSSNQGVICRNERERLTPSILHDRIMAHAGMAKPRQAIAELRGNGNGTACSSAGRTVTAGEDDRATSRGIEGEPIAGDQDAVALLDVLVGSLVHAAPARHADPDSFDDPFVDAGQAQLTASEKLVTAVPLGV